MGLIKENIYNIKEINSPIQSFNISLVILSVGYLFKVSTAPIFDHLCLWLSNGH